MPFGWSFACEIMLDLNSKIGFFHKSPYQHTYHPNNTQSTQQHTNNPNSST